MINGAAPFGSRDYITLRFNQEDEEHLVPRPLIEKSRVIRELIDKSHDNHIQLQGIASSTFEDLIHFINREYNELDADRVQHMIQAAHSLELTEAESQLVKILNVIKNLSK